MGGGGGGSGQWLKSLVKPKKPQSHEFVSESGKGGRKWKVWKTSTKGTRTIYVAASDMSDSSGGREEAFALAVAAAFRAPVKDIMAARKEWAAARIQTAFRRFLGRRVMRVLRAVVKIQAVFRGRKVRKQAAVTLSCVQALVRVQARVRARSSALLSNGQAMQQSFNQRFISSQIEPRNSVSEVLVGN